jgi:hypothetical protein
LPVELFSNDQSFERSDLCIAFGAFGGFMLFALAIGFFAAPV